jgi:hypothetical protein
VPDANDYHMFDPPEILPYNPTDDQYLKNTQQFRDLIQTGTSTTSSSSSSSSSSSTTTSSAKTEQDPMGSGSLVRKMIVQSTFKGTGKILCVFFLG